MTTSTAPVCVFESSCMRVLAVSVAALYVIAKRSMELSPLGRAKAKLLLIFGMTFFPMETEVSVQHAPRWPSGGGFCKGMALVEKSEEGFKGHSTFGFGPSAGQQYTRVPVFASEDFTQGSNHSLASSRRCIVKSARVVYESGVTKTTHLLRFFPILT